MVKGEKREEKGSEDAPGAGSQSSWEHETVVSNTYRITPEMQEAANVLEIHPQGIIYLSGPLPPHRLVFSKLRANPQPDSNCPHRSRQAAALQKKKTHFLGLRKATMPKWRCIWFSLSFARELIKMCLVIPEGERAAAKPAQGRHVFHFGRN